MEGGTLRMHKDPEKRKAYANAFRAKTYKQFSFRLRPEEYKDVIDKLQSVDSVPKYITSLIREDIKKSHLN